MVSRPSWCVWLPASGEMPRIHLQRYSSLLYLYSITWILNRQECQPQCVVIRMRFSGRAKELASDPSRVFNVARATPLISAGGLHLAGQRTKDSLGGCRAAERPSSKSLHSARGHAGAGGPTAQRQATKCSWIWGGLRVLLGARPSAGGAGGQAGAPALLARCIREWQGPAGCSVLWRSGKGSAGDSGDRGATASRAT